MKRSYALCAVFVPITAGLVLLWPVDDVFTADADTTTVSSAVASASSAIATASSAIATASSAIATASSAIATASSAVVADPSSAAVDAIACDNDTADLCNTAATVTSTTSARSGNDDDCSTVAASALRLGHGAEESPTAARVNDDRGRIDRNLDVDDSRRRVDDYGRVVVRPRTVGLKTIERIILTAVSMFFEKLELAVFMSLYKIKVLYTTLISPVLHSF
ncbi:uncharacterized protein LOC112600331 [Melanaphis sacchari]|uniref:uncharacterized protein LOC112600331 n=1 Tax=Melanaphis sacchari TaxID=742174 RepID=UPI000DC1426C|nr:uncharacterized protein LOC112600331 [Melanaphis sacchari]